MTHGTICFLFESTKDVNSVGHWIWVLWFCKLKRNSKMLEDRELPDIQTGFTKGRGTRGQIAICWIIEKVRVTEKHLLLLYWLCQSLWLCGSQQTVENSERDEIPDHLTSLPEKSVCRSRSNSYNWTWNNRLVPNRKRSMSRLYIVTLLI